MSKHTALRFSFDISVEAFRAKLDAEADRIARELGITRKSFAEQVKDKPAADVMRAIAERTAK